MANHCPTAIAQVQKNLTNYEEPIDYDVTWNAFVEMVPEENIRQLILGESFEQLLPSSLIVE